MSKISKIDSLPNDLREQINHRILDGVATANILLWLKEWLANVPAKQTITSSSYVKSQSNPGKLMQVKARYCGLLQAIIQEKIHFRSMKCLLHPHGGRTARCFKGIQAIHTWHETIFFLCSTPGVTGTMTGAPIYANLRREASWTAAASGARRRFRTSCSVQSAILLRTGNCVPIQVSTQVSVPLCLVAKHAKIRGFRPISDRFRPNFMDQFVSQMAAMRPVPIRKPCQAPSSLVKQLSEKIP